MSIIFITDSNICCYLFVYLLLLFVAGIDQHFVTYQTNITNVLILIHLSSISFLMSTHFVGCLIGATVVVTAAPFWQVTQWTICCGFSSSFQNASHFNSFIHPFPFFCARKLEYQLVSWRVIRCTSDDHHVNDSWMTFDDIWWIGGYSDGINLSSFKIEISTNISTKWRQFGFYQIKNSL